MQLLDFSKGLKDELERAVVNEPSVFEPLKFYCIQKILKNIVKVTLVEIFPFLFTIKQSETLKVVNL